MNTLDDLSITTTQCSPPLLLPIYLDTTYYMSVVIVEYCGASVSEVATHRQRNAVDVVQA